MKIVFISNYINHHQIPFCESLYSKLGDNFIFIQTQPMESERKAMGWEVDIKKIPYVRCMYESYDECMKLVLEADALIAGWMEDPTPAIKRMEQHKLTIRISERIYREGQWKAVSLRGLKAKKYEHVRFKNDPAYLLCAGAYVPSDFNLIGAYPSKMYRFGYFPEFRSYDIEELLERKNKSEYIEIIYAGRFMPLKHPEYMIRLAEDILKEPNLPKCRIHMVGSGEMEDELKQMVKDKGLEDAVRFYGFLLPGEVREVMENSHIHVFPSNHLEGWGAVVNEAMNSGCAEVASVEAGCVPTLITQWENGVAYPKNDYVMMKEAVIKLAAEKELREKIAKNAYRTIEKYWNSDYAACMLMNMIEGWLKGEDRAPKEGPLSPAPVISPRKMFSVMEKGEQERKNKCFGTDR